MNTNINKIGYRSGMLAFTATVAFFIAQVFQLLGMLSYPYDEILIYGFSLCIVIPFLFEMLALHHITTGDKKIWSHAMVSFTIIYAVFAIANYVVQLATVIPMTLKGASEEIRILIQSPHSMFWDYDAIAYIFMGFASFCAVPLFEKIGFQKWVRVFFLANGLVTPLIAFVYFYPDFSEQLLLIGLPWVVTAPVSMLLLALLFRKNSQK